MDAGTSRQLEDLIRRLQAATGDVLVVATVKTFQPWPDIKSMAVKMFQNGGKGIGTKGKDNGALLLLALDDRQVWVEVGYGLEGFVTDGFAGETSRDTMVPFFRRGEYGQGLLAGATRLAGRIAEGRNVDLPLTPVRPPATARRQGRHPVRHVDYPRDHHPESDRPAAPRIAVGPWALVERDRHVRRWRLWRRRLGFWRRLWRRLRGLWRRALGRRRWRRIMVEREL